MSKYYPNSVIRERTDYVRMLSIFSAAFAKGVAGNAFGKSGREDAGNRPKSVSKHHP